MGADHHWSAGLSGGSDCSSAVGPQHCPEKVQVSVIKPGIGSMHGCTGCWCTHEISEWNTHKLKSYFALILSISVDIIL